MKFKNLICPRFQLKTGTCFVRKPPVGGCLLPRSPRYHLNTGACFLRALRTSSWRPERSLGRGGEKFFLRVWKNARREATTAGDRASTRVRKFSLSCVAMAIGRAWRKAAAGSWLRRSRSRRRGRRERPRAWARRPKRVRLRNWCWRPRPSEPILREIATISWLRDRCRFDSII